METFNVGAWGAGPRGIGHDDAKAFLTGGATAPVLPSGTRNLAFIGHFIELPRDVVFTVEHSACSAQAAMQGLPGLQREAPPVYQGIDSCMLLKASWALHDVRA